MVPGFPESEQDTSCLPAIQNYVAAFCAKRPDLDVHVVAFQYPFVRRDYPWKGATVHALGGRNRRHLLRLPTWTRAVRLFSRLAQRTNVRFLHTFWLTECSRVGQWLGKRHGVPHVASVGGVDAKPDNPYLSRLRLRDLVLTAGSSFAAETLAAHADVGEIQVVPLGLDTEHLAAIDKPEIRDIDVIGAGSLIPLKDYGAFVDVIAALVDELPEIRACLVGDGPLREALEERIVACGLEDNVVLVGHLPRDDVFRHMLRSKVLLHPSKYESQGYVFLEALFAGLNVVCYDVGHAGDSDRVFRGGSQRDLVDAVRELVRDPGPLHRQQVPTVDDTVRAFEAIYRTGSDNR